MSFLDQIGVLILTLDEEPNIGRTLESLKAFPDVVVLDSGSTDETAAIANRYPNVRLVVRPFDSHANQWNFGLNKCGIERPWILALDADYVLTPAVVKEIATFAPTETVSGYRASFNYCVFGRRLSATLYPAAIVLFRREKAHYKQFGHTQRVLVRGNVGDLRARIDHDDRKALSRWFSSQQKYAALEADHLLTTPRYELRITDRIRLLGWLAPMIVPIYTLLYKRCLFDGWPGWYYTMQRTLAEILIVLSLIERHFGLNNDRNG